MKTFRIGLKHLSAASLVLLTAACGGGGGGSAAVDGSVSQAGGPGTGTPDPTAPDPQQPPSPGPQINMPPLISGEAVNRVVAGAHFDFTPQASDPNNDALSFEAQNLPDWLRLDSSTGNVFGSPGLDQLGAYRNITITAFDGQASTSLTPFDIVVDAPVFSANNFKPAGNVMDTVDGYTVKGELAFEFAGRSQTIKNANLAVTLDAGGNLLDIAGEGTLPPKLDELVTLDAGVSATVGLLSGVEINNDDRFDVNVLDTRQYMLFYLDYGITLEVENPAFPGQVVSVSAPSIPGIPNFLMITDPYDPMYYYGDGEEFGWAYSVQGLLPFVPYIDHPIIKPFEGHHYAKGTIPLGFKVFDFFSFTGESIVFDPTFNSMTDPDYFSGGESGRNAGARAGFNGAFAFDLSIGPVGLFSFDIGESTAAFEFNLENQYFVMLGSIEPDVSWAPSWMPFVPETSLTAELTHEITAAGPSVNANFTGAYKSELPKADVEGSIKLTLDSATMEAVVRDVIDIPISVTFKENETHARVGLNVDFSDEVSSAVDATFDEVQSTVDNAIAEYEEAYGNYQVAVSLNGIRDNLEGIANTAIGKLNAVPETVRSTVYNEVIAGINSRRVCFIGCVPSNSSRNRHANNAANAARTDASNAIAPYVSALNTLKTRAEEVDDASLRNALEQVLRTVHANRQFTRTISRTVTFDVLGKTYSASGSRTVNLTVLDSNTAGDILYAANHVQDISATETFVISTQDVLSNLPTQEILDEARAIANERLADYSGVESVGYSVINGDYSAYVEFSSGERHGVSFNVLSFDEAVAGITDLLAAAVVGQ